MYFVLFVRQTDSHFHFYNVEDWKRHYELPDINGYKHVNEVEVKEGKSIDLEDLFKLVHLNEVYQG